MAFNLLHWFFQEGEHSMPEFNQTRLWSHDNEAYRKQHPDWYKDEVLKPDTASQGSSDPMRVIIEPPTFKSEKITDTAVMVPKSFEFRPQTWDQFIGQKEAKERAQVIIKQFQRGMRSHLILSAIKGHGKTSYIELLAKSIGAHLIQRIGRQIDEINLVEIINEINTCAEATVVFFIDEIDTMDKNVIKILNPIIESFQIAGKKIKPFIFACATINKSLLLKNNPDTLDRIQHHINFSRYTPDELGQILNQYKKELYPSEPITAQDINLIALNCKYNPRTSINLLEFLVVEQSMNSVLKNCRIIKDGLTAIDVKILEVLASSKKPVGSNAIAMRCGMSQLEYEREWEPFLYEFEYLNRCPSRVITEKGKKFLEDIKK